jgi:hypothetical protein
MMTNEEILKTLQGLSKLTGFSIEEIAYMARMFAQAEYDPLPPDEWGEPFEFSMWRVSLFGREFDFDCIHAEVPKPDAQVDLLIALRECVRDMKAIAAIYAAHPDLSLLINWKIYSRLLEWERFWAVRHLDPKVRKSSERRVLEMEAMRNGFSEKAEALLRKRGVMVMA